MPAQHQVGAPLLISRDIGRIVGQQDLIPAFVCWSGQFSNISSCHRCLSGIPCRAKSTPSAGAEAMGCLMGISIQRKRQTGNPDFSSGQRNIGRFIFQKMDTCRCQFLPIIIQHIPVLFHLAFQPLLMIAQGIIYRSDLRPIRISPGLALRIFSSKMSFWLPYTRLCKSLKNTILFSFVGPFGC